MSVKQNLKTVVFSLDSDLEKKLIAFAANNGFTLEDAVNYILAEQFGQSINS